MKLFEFNADAWELTISEEAYTLLPFKKIIQADKTKDKELAFKELAFIWHYADIKSDYSYILNDKEKESEIKNDIGLPKTWKRSKLIDEAIEFYKERSKTVSSIILENSLFIANTISNKMRKAIGEDDDTELSIKEMDQVASGLAKMPGIVASLQKLEQTVLKEMSEKSDRVGSQDKAIFEDGFK